MSVSTGSGAQSPRTSRPPIPMPRCPSRPEAVRLGPRHQRLVPRSGLLVCATVTPTYGYGERDAAVTLRAALLGRQRVQACLTRTAAWPLCGPAPHAAHGPVRAPGPSPQRHRRSDHPASGGRGQSPSTQTGSRTVAVNASKRLLDIHETAAFGVKRRRTRLAGSARSLVSLAKQSGTAALAGDGFKPTCLESLFDRGVAEREDAPRPGQVPGYEPRCVVANPQLRNPRATWL